MLSQINKIALLATLSTSALALPFNISVTSGTSLPTSVAQGQTAIAYYTVTNMTHSQRNGNYVKWLPPNVTQVTAGGVYGDTCGELHQKKCYPKEEFLESLLHN